jgi:hypothetical protein
MVLDTNKPHSYAGMQELVGRLPIRTSGGQTNRD